MHQNSSTLIDPHNPHFNLQTTSSQFPQHFHSPGYASLCHKESSYLLYQFGHGNINLATAISMWPLQFQFGHGNFNLATAKSIWPRQYQFTHVTFMTSSCVGHSGSSSDSEADGAELEASFDEEEVLKYYFNRGFNYQEILTFLSERHHHSLSYNTLL